MPLEPNAIYLFVQKPEGPGDGDPDGWVYVPTNYLCASVHKV
jgi:hypothetical protein